MSDAALPEVEVFLASFFSPPNQLTERPTDTLRPSDAAIRSALR